MRDLDANILLPFSPDAGKSSNSQDLLNPPPLQIRFLSCELEIGVLEPPLCLLEYRLFKVKRRARTEARTLVTTAAVALLRGWQRGAI